MMHVIRASEHVQANGKFKRGAGARPAHPFALVLFSPSINLLRNLSHNDHHLFLPTTTSKTSSKADQDVLYQLFQTNNLFLRRWFSVRCDVCSWRREDHSILKVSFALETKAFFSMHALVFQNVVYFGENVIFSQTELSLSGDSCTGIYEWTMWFSWQISRDVNRGTSLLPLKKSWASRLLPGSSHQAQNRKIPRHCHTVGKEYSTEDFVEFATSITESKLQAVLLDLITLCAWISFIHALTYDYTSNPSHLIYLHQSFLLTFFVFCFFVLRMIYLCYITGA